MFCFVFISKNPFIIFLRGSPDPGWHTSHVGLHLPCLGKYGKKTKQILRLNSSYWISMVRISAEKDIQNIFVVSPTLTIRVQSCGDTVLSACTWAGPGSEPMIEGDPIQVHAYGTRPHPGPSPGPPHAFHR